MYLFREGRDILINSKTKCSVLLMQIANQKKKKVGEKRKVKLSLYSDGKMHHQNVMNASACAQSSEDSC